MAGKITARNITRRVLETFGGAPNPRFRQVMTSLVKHLHAFVREVDLTQEEWERAIAFLTATGHITTDQRQEFVLLSDTLGVSALVQFLADGREPPQATASSLLGPFFVEGAPERAFGASIADKASGPLVLVRGQVRTISGAPLARALIDVWQADPRGYYDIQDAAQPPMNLRGRFRTGADGRYEFRTVKPAPYPVPTDGPVGDVLRALGRHPFRPAHIHFLIQAEGCRPLVTALYPRGAYEDSDAVFGVRRELLVNFRKAADPSLAVAEQLDFDFVLSSGGPAT